MKPKTLALISLILLVAIIGTGTFAALSAPDVKANVKWDPKSYTWDGVPPPWNAEISLTGGHKRHEIDTSTILLEGTYSPGTPYNATHGPRLILPFDGLDVKAAIEPYLPWHMGVVMPGRYRIELEITGNLLPEYGGELFRGTGVITVTVPESPG